MGACTGTSGTCSDAGVMVGLAGVYCRGEEWVIVMVDSSDLGSVACVRLWTLLFYGVCRVCARWLCVYSIIYSAMRWGLRVSLSDLSHNSLSKEGVRYIQHF